MANVEVRLYCVLIYTRQPEIFPHTCIVEPREAGPSPGRVNKCEEALKCSQGSKAIHSPLSCSESLIGAKH
jgi:hypothetical protein